MKKFRLLQFSVFCCFLLMAFQLTGQQKFLTHAVQEGETIYSISKQYKVTPYSILQENPEVKDVENIKPNTLLIIPVSQKVKANFSEDKVEYNTQVEPLGFKKHKVKKRERIEDILQKYGITEQQLKRYNAELYAEPVAKGNGTSNSAIPGCKS